MQLTGAQALIKSLEMEGVEVMFGLPGGAILPVYDPLIDSSIPPQGDWKYLTDVTDVSGGG